MAFLALKFPAPAFAQRQMEALGRGVVALHSATSQAYVGWRLLATDPSDIGFNVYRSANGGPGVKINLSGAITNTTDFVDTTANFAQSNAWYVVPVIGGIEQTPGAPFGLAPNSPVRQYLPIPLKPVIGGLSPPYDVKFCWVGDFDGDGEHDFLVDRLTVTATNKLNQYLQAYKRDGTFLWQMDLGFNSTNTANTYEPGASAISVGDKDNVTVYDLDGDGKAEVIVRTANGVVFGDGAVLTAANNTVQFLSVIDGMTGHEKARATMPNPYFADGPLNSHFGILYCDGVHPSILVDGENRVGTGAFQRIAVAWDYRDGQLIQRWQHIAAPGENDSRAQQLRVADVNHDGKDDVVQIGAVWSGPDGALLYQTELQHGDRYHVTDIDPDRPGLEMYAIQQSNPTLLATALQDLGSGVLYRKWYSSGIVDVGRGITLDMDPNHRGCEMYSTQPGIFDAKGNRIYANTIWPPEGLWWDADLSREFEDGAGSGGLSPVVNKFNPATGTAVRLYTIYNEDGGVHQAYGGRAAFWGDILGDWREEMVLVANDYSQIRIYTTKIAATNRLYCLMQNPQYRVQCTYKGYYQASYVDYYLGTEMPPPPPPPVSNARLVWRGDGTNLWDDGVTANWFTNGLWISNNTAVRYTSGDTVLFDLTGSNNTAITLVGSLAPGDVGVHSPKDYTFAGTGELTGAMGLTKAGAGKLTFNGTNTYTGKTLIAEGPFIVNGSLPSSPVTVRGGVWLDGRLGGIGVVGSAVSIQEGAGLSPGAGSLSPGTLTIANNLTLAGRTLNDFDLSDDPTGAIKANDLIAVAGDLTLRGTNTIVVHKLDATLPPGVYPLINYSGALSGNLNNLAVAGLDGVPLALTNPPGRIALVIRSTRAPTTLTWTGGQNGNAWDIATSSNFLNGAAKDWFVPQDSVRFDNIGASNLTVTLIGTLLASNVIVDSTANYTFTGSGAIGGPASLTKSNTGTLTISASNNSYTGRTFIAGGTVVVSRLDAVGNPSPLGNPAAGATNLVLAGNSTLRVTGESYTDRGMTLNAGTNTIDVFNSGDQVTIAGQIVGSGALVKGGAGTLALTVGNTFSGGTIINGGMVALGSVAGNQAGVGTGPVTLNNGTLSMINIQASETCAWNLIVPTNATGRLEADGRCALTGSLTGGGTFNVWTPYVRTDFSGNWSAFTGRINVITDSDGGDFRCNNAAGYPNAKINLAALTTLQNRVAGTPTIPVGEISGAAGSYINAPGGNSGIAVNWRVGGLNTSATFAGTIANGVGIIKVGTGTWTLTGTNTYTGPTTISNGVLQIGNGGASGTLGSNTVANYATLTFNRSDAIDDAGFGVISGSGHVIKRGSGTLAFFNPHTFAGVMSIEAGTLALTNAGSVAASNIYVGSGTLFDVSRRTGGAFTLASGQTLSGDGSIKGALTIGNGAVLSPGSDAIGRLTFSNSLTLAAGSLCRFEINRSPKTNDVARIFGVLTIGGILIVTNVGGGALAANDTFKLFDAAGYSGAFAGVVLPPLNPGLAWDLSLLNSAGTLKVIVVTPPSINAVNVFGDKFVFGGTGGVAGAAYYVLNSTNVALPIQQWVRVATNQFNDDGCFSFTNRLDPGVPQSFYLLQVP